MELAPTQRQSGRRPQERLPVPTAAISRYAPRRREQRRAQPAAQRPQRIVPVTALHQLPNTIEVNGRMSPLNTHYNCDNAHFSLTRCHNGVDMEDDWHPAKVSVTEIGDNHRELIDVRFRPGPTALTTHQAGCLWLTPSTRALRLSFGQSRKDGRYTVTRSALPDTHSTVSPGTDTCNRGLLR